MSAQNALQKRVAELNSKGLPAIKLQTGKEPQPAKRQRTQEPSKHGKVAAPKPESNEPTRPSLKGTTTGITIRTHALATASRPIGALRKLLIDTVRDADAPLTVQQLSEKAKVQLGNEPALLKWLKEESALVEWLAKDGKFKYRPKHEIRGRQGLLQHFKHAPTGTVIDQELKDSYKNIHKDIEALKAEGRVYVFFNHDLQLDVVYPVDDGLAYKAIAYDKEIADLWRQIKVPLDPTKFREAIRETTLKTSRLDAQPRQRLKLEPVKRAKSKRNNYRPTAVTNYHMPELHEGPQPDQID